MIDIQYLASLFEDEVLVRKYLERFHEDMPKILLQMRTSYQDQNWSELSILAHSYKCQLQYLNENDTAALAYELEKISSRGVLHPPRGVLHPPLPSPDSNAIGELITQLENNLVPTLAEIWQIIG